MSSALGRIEERFTLGQLDLNGLVTKTEDLPVSEHSAWIDRMAQTVVTSPRPAERSGRPSLHRARSRWGIAVTTPRLPRPEALILPQIY